MQERTHFKLGLFTIVALAALVVTAGVLGYERSQGETVRYVTYFDESVQGLDRGAPVKFRGVGVGTVSDIAIAPDHRHVRVGLAIARGSSGDIAAVNDQGILRAELSSQGITGVKFVDLDAPANPAPPEKLPFPVEPNTIPSHPSFFGALAGDVRSASRELPDVIAASRRTVEKIDRLVDELAAEHVPARLGKVLDRADQLLADIDRHRLAERAGVALDDLHVTAKKIDAVLGKLHGVDGLVAGGKRAADSLGDLARAWQRASSRLDKTLGQVGDAARSLRDFVEDLEREPDMLLKGRGKSRR